MIPFPFNENLFLFFVADHLLVGQFCTNPKSDRSLLSCLKVTQCSTSEIGDTPVHKSKETQAWLQKECYDFLPFRHCPPSSPDLNPLDYFVWTFVENITNMTSHNTKASLIAAIRRVIAELPPALVEKHAPSSGSVSSRWLRLKTATLNRCQIYYIIK